jgi:hypothetical protein
VTDKWEKWFENGLSQKTLISGSLAVLLLGLFILVNFYRNYQVSHQPVDQVGLNDREKLPARLEGKGKRLAFYDFEQGNANDTSTHLARIGHTGKQSLKMSVQVSFSPGLWIKFKDLNPGDSSWIRATGYIWFNCNPAEAKCSLVATCNRNGVSYKYMSIPIEKEAIHPDQWNRISIDYLIPPPPDREDVLLVYFWYRGAGDLLVDDIEIDFFSQ